MIPITPPFLFLVRSIENIEEIDEYIDDELLRQIRTKTSEDFLGEIKEALLEIIHNVRDHSHSDVLYMCGQHYPRKPRDSKKGNHIFCYIRQWYWHDRKHKKQRTFFL